MTVKESNKILDKLLPKIYEGQYDILFEIWLKNIKEIKSNEDLVIYKTPKWIEFMAPVKKVKMMIISGQQYSKDMIWFFERKKINIEHWEQPI